MTSCAVWTIPPPLIIEPRADHLKLASPKPPLVMNHQSLVTVLSRHDPISVDPSIPIDLSQIRRSLRSFFNRIGAFLRIDLAILRASLLSSSMVRSLISFALISF